MNARKVSMLLVCLIATSAAFAAPLTPPPQAPVCPATDDYFGTKVVDNYRYFEDLKNPEVLSWMTVQSDTTRATLDGLPGRAALAKRMTELVLSTPAQVSDLRIVSGHYYTLRTPAGAQLAKLYMRDGVHGQDRLLIDPEKLPGANGAHLSISSYPPSSDGSYIAYGVSPGGSEQPVLHVFDVHAGKDLAGTLDHLNSATPHWRDTRSFFYTRRQTLKAGMAATEKFKNERTCLHRLRHAFDADPVILGHDVNPVLPVTETEVADIATAANSHYAVAFVSPGTDPRLRVYVAPVATLKDATTHWRAVAASYDDLYIGGDNPDVPVIALSGDTLYWLSVKGALRGQILKLDLTKFDAKPAVLVAQGDQPISATAVLMAASATAARP